MKLIDRNTLDDTFTSLNKDGWELTQYEHERMENVLFNMPEVDAVPIPKNATNGDMFLMLFPNVLATKLPHAVFVDFKDNITQLAFDRYWWDSKYKGGD